MTISCIRGHIAKLHYGHSHCIARHTLQVVCASILCVDGWAGGPQAKTNEKQRGGSKFDLPTLPTLPPRVSLPA
jgi:hypothetical protein